MLVHASAVHFHDLRHTGNSLAAESGASLRDLMERMGHASTRAALIYLHSSKARGKAIAGHLDDQLTAAMATLAVRGRRAVDVARAWHAAGPKITRNWPGTT